MWGLKKKHGQVFQILVVPKPLLLGAPLLKKRSCNAWVMEECQCIAEDSRVRVYLSEPQESRWKKWGSALKKAALIMFRPAGSVGLTYLYFTWAAEQAFLQRGYAACGGEYVILPLVFYGAYKGLGWIEKLVHSDRVHGKLTKK